MIKYFYVFLELFVSFSVFSMEEYGNFNENDVYEKSFNDDDDSGCENKLNHEPYDFKSQEVIYDNRDPLEIEYYDLEKSWKNLKLQTRSDRVWKLMKTDYGAQCLDWAKQIAQESESEQQHMEIGLLYLNGGESSGCEVYLGIGKDLDEAIFWFKKAAMLGEAEGYFKIAEIYEKEKINYKAAQFYYEKFLSMFVNSEKLKERAHKALELIKGKLRPPKQLGGTQKHQKHQKDKRKNDPKEETSTQFEDQTWVNVKEALYVLNIHLSDGCIEMINCAGKNSDNVSELKLKFKENYKELTRKFHPDQADEKDKESYKEKMTKINSAHITVTEFIENIK